MSFINFPILETVRKLCSDNNINKKLCCITVTDRIITTHEVIKKKTQKLKINDNNKSVRSTKIASIFGDLQHLTG